MRSHTPYSLYCSTAFDRERPPASEQGGRGGATLPATTVAAHRISLSWLGVGTVEPSRKGHARIRIHEYGAADNRTPPLDLDRAQPGLDLRRWPQRRCTAASAAAPGRCGKFSVVRSSSSSSRLVHAQPLQNRDDDGAWAGWL